MLKSRRRLTMALARGEPPEGLEEWPWDLEAIVRAGVAREQGDPERALDLLAHAPLWTVYRLDPRRLTID